MASRKRTQSAKSPAKKQSKDGGSSRRKGSSRGDISHAGVKKLLTVSSGLTLVDKDSRVAAQAVDYTIDRLQQFLGQLAKELNRLLSIAKKKTLTSELIRQAVESLGKPARVANATETKRKGERSVISSAGVLRQLKANGLSKDVRSSDVAKSKLAAVSAAYVSHLGSSAGCIAKSAGRKTIMGRDIHAVQCQGY